MIKEDGVVMFVLVNFANEAYKKTQKVNSLSGKIFGKFDAVHAYSSEDIEPEYYEKHRTIFENPRGCGLWLWKPYLIYKELNLLAENDYLFYSDSGAFFVANPKGIIKSMGDDPIWLYGLPLIEKQFTKQLVFEALNCDCKDYSETNQFSATFIVIRNCEYSRNFVKKWLSLCENEKLLSDKYDGEKNPDCFVAHREDQSILSLLAKKEHIRMHKDPTQYGKLPEKYRNDGWLFKKAITDDKYGMILVHHRTPDVNIKTSLRQLLCGVLPRKIGVSLIRR